MPHPEREHELQIALATALRERDAAKDRAQQLNSVALERGRQIAFERERFSETRKELTALKSERDDLRVEVKRLREALTEYVELSDVSLDSLERVASEFYKATGYLAPGKDIPAALDSDAYRERRQLRWNEWARAKYDARLAHARAALAAPGDGEEGKHGT